MAINTDHILLASAANRRKKERSRLILIATIGLAGVALSLILFSKSSRDMNTDIKVVEEKIQLDRKILASRQKGIQEKSDIDELYDIYIGAFQPALLALSKGSAYASQTTDLNDEIEELFLIGNNKIQSKIVAEIQSRLNTATALFTKIQAEIDSANARLNQAFLSLDAKGYVQELANLAIIDSNNEDVIARQRKEPQVIEYFAYQLSANRAKTERNGASELYALSKVMNLGFGSIDTRSRIKVLQKNIADEKFSYHIKQTNNYIARKEFKQAAKELKIASSLYPKRGQVKELRKTIDDNLKGIRVANLVTEAELYAQQDRWLQAKKSYSKALSIRANDRLAIDGEALATSILELKAGLLDISSQPLRLKDINILNYAQRLLSDSLTMLPKSLTLEGLYRDVALLVNSKSKPRSVIIKSDGRARIKVQGVGYINPTKQKTISLSPGEYRLYAECEGNQTKLYEIVIPIDDEISPIRVACGREI